MRKQIALLFAPVLTLLGASPLPATVFINCADLGNGTVELSYDSSQESVPVRAFSLDITVSSGVITSVGDLSAEYWVYPGSFSRYVLIDNETGEIEEVLPGYSPVAPADEPGALGGLGTSGMTIEMGALYLPEANAPGPVGVLLTFTVSAPCNVTVRPNAMRGGIVLENAMEAEMYAPGLPGVGGPAHGIYGGGTGTVSDPYLISTPDQMNTIGLNPGDWYSRFKLVADIDLDAYTGTNFNIIGTSLNRPFMGVFDGNDHTLYNFTYSSTDSDCIGLFGALDGSRAEIRNLCLIGPNVGAGTGSSVGSLVGCMKRGAISGCCAMGGRVAGRSAVGGLVGRNYEGTIINSYAKVKVIAESNAGGLVGRGYETILNCYSAGHVDADANEAGGLVGYNHGVVTASFWDEESSGQANGAGGTGATGVTEATAKTTALMQTAETFIDAGWDFEGESVNGTADIWTIREGKTYPRFARQIPKGDFLGREWVNLVDFAYFAGRWRQGNCADSNDCDGADLDAKGTVDAGDFILLARNWLAGAN